jgi:hypothetical protein
MANMIRNARAAYHADALMLHHPLLSVRTTCHITPRLHACEILCPYCHHMGCAQLRGVYTIAPTLDVVAIHPTIWGIGRSNL